MFKRLYIKLLVRLGKAVNISSKGKYPADILSNLRSNRFVFEDVVCESMEGFLQSLKREDVARQQEICALKGRDAKRAATTNWQRDQRVWWKGQAIERQSEEFQTLVRRAYDALFEQNTRFRMALMSTKGKRLYHLHGGNDPRKTILTAQEFCQILTELRSKNEDKEMFGTGSRH
ncbi:MAG: hypothetical protein II793_02220 [Bacteroidales bacterium]|nr:hypothetical protein [Bacteroidales bacterium]